MVDKDAFDRFFSQPLLWFVVSFVLLGVLVDVQFVTVDHRSLAQSELFALLDNLLIGILVSFVFYFLIVHVPEQQRRKRLRESFLRYYLSIKEALIWQIVFASRAAGRLDLDTRQEQIDKLMNVDGFKAAFSGGREANEGWYAFLNHMSQDSLEFQEILLNFIQLRAQVDYLLSQSAIDELELIDFFTWLRRRLLRLERTKSDDWEKRALAQFLYEVFAGWDPITGYRNFDIIEDGIQKIV